MDVEWDPYRMTEGISDDPVARPCWACGTCGPQRRTSWSGCSEPGDDYYELETHYLQNLTQWNRYAEHAAAAVGGSWTHHKRYGEEGVVYTPIEPDYQRKAMKFIDEHVLQTPDVGAGRRPAAPAGARRRRGTDPGVPGTGRTAVC
jgi:hypothetical protein